MHVRTHDCQDDTSERWRTGDVDGTHIHSSPDAPTGQRGREQRRRPIVWSENANRQQSAWSGNADPQANDEYVSCHQPASVRAVRHMGRRARSASKTVSAARGTHPLAQRQRSALRHKLKCTFANSKCKRNPVRVTPQPTMTRQAGFPRQSEPRWLASEVATCERPLGTCARQSTCSAR